MNRCFALAIGIAAVSGCSGISYDSKSGLAKVSNAERTFVVDYGANPPLKRCLEAPGPAALLNDSNFEAALKGSADKITDAELKLIMQNTESVSKLYEVSSILQYAHAMSYRFCETALNGYISGPEYYESLNRLMKSTEALLRIHLETAVAQKETAEIQSRTVEKELQLYRLESPMTQ